MRKVLAAIMAIVMVLSGYVVMAETVEVEETVLPPEQFTFRNNISWKSTIEDIQQAEITELVIDKYYDSFHWLSYGDASVSNYVASLDYIFLNEQLCFIGYRFNPRSASDRIYLIEALASKYGEPNSNDVEPLKMLNTLFKPGDSEVILHQSWKLADDTYIAAATEGGMFFILYYNEAELLSQSGIFNTNGL